MRPLRPLLRFLLALMWPWLLRCCCSGWARLRRGSRKWARGARAGEPLSVRAGSAARTRGDMAARLARRETLEARRRRELGDANARKTVRFARREIKRETERERERETEKRGGHAPATTTRCPCGAVRQARVQRVRDAPLRGSRRRGAHARKETQAHAARTEMRLRPAARTRRPTC